MENNDNLKEKLNDNIDKSNKKICDFLINENLIYNTDVYILLGSGFDKYIKEKKPESIKEPIMWKSKITENFDHDSLYSLLTCIDKEEYINQINEYNNWLECDTKDIDFNNIELVRFINSFNSCNKFFITTNHTRLIEKIFNISNKYYLNNIDNNDKLTRIIKKDANSIIYLHTIYEKNKFDYVIDINDYSNNYDYICNISKWFKNVFDKNKNNRKKVIIVFGVGLKELHILKLINNFEYKIIFISYKFNNKSENIGNKIKDFLKKKMKLKESNSYYEILSNYGKNEENIITPNKDYSNFFTMFLKAKAISDKQYNNDYILNIKYKSLFDKNEISNDLTNEWKNYLKRVISIKKRNISLFENYYKLVCFINSKGYEFLLKKLYFPNDLKYLLIPFYLCNKTQEAEYLFQYFISKQNIDYSEYVNHSNIHEWLNFIFSLKLNNTDKINFFINFISMIISKIGLSRYISDFNFSSINLDIKYKNIIEMYNSTKFETPINYDYKFNEQIKYLEIFILLNKMGVIEETFSLDDFFELMKISNWIDRIKFIFLVNTTYFKFYFINEYYWYQLLEFLNKHSQIIIDIDVSIILKYINNNNFNLVNVDEDMFWRIILDHPIIYNDDEIKFKFKNKIDFNLESTSTRLNNKDKTQEILNNLQTCDIKDLISSIKNNNKINDQFLYQYKDDIFDIVLKRLINCDNVKDNENIIEWCNNFLKSNLVYINGYYNFFTNNMNQFYNILNICINKKLDILFNQFLSWFINVDSSPLSVIYPWNNNISYIDILKELSKSNSIEDIFNILSNKEYHTIYLFILKNINKPLSISNRNENDIFVILYKRNLNLISEDDINKYFENNNIFWEQVKLISDNIAKYNLNNFHFIKWYLYFVLSSYKKANKKSYISFLKEVFNYILETKDKIFINYDLIWWLITTKRKSLNLANVKNEIVNLLDANLWNPLKSLNINNFSSRQNVLIKIYNLLDENSYKNWFLNDDINESIQKIKNFKFSFQPQFKDTRKIVKIELFKLKFMTKFLKSSTIECIENIDIEKITNLEWEELNSIFLEINKM